MYTARMVALYKWLLQHYARKGDTILDTHLGSGSSRIAAYDMGFDFVGIEMLAWLNIQEAIDESKKKTGKQGEVSRKKAIPRSKCPDPRECAKTVSWPW